jgi:hypothetical protein
MLAEPASLYDWPTEHLVIARKCLTRPTLLTLWERDFLISVQRMLRPTDKQLQALFEIAAKLGVEDL